MNDSFILAGLAISLLLGGLFTALRTAFASLDPGLIDEQAAAGREAARAVKTLLDLPLRTQLSISIPDSLVVALTVLLASLLASLQRADGWGILNVLGSSLVALWTIKGIGGLVGLTYANSIALAAAGSLRIMVWVVSPIASMGGWIARRFRPKLYTHTDNKVTADEIQITVMEGKEPRVIDEIEPEEKKMIAGIIELKDTTASEIMVPRIDVVALEVNQPVSRALEIVIQHGHSRLPVYDDNIDHIVGLLHAKELLRVPAEGKSLRELLRPPYFVPESARVSDLLHDLQRRRMHMAIVVDEYGGTAGLVTIEDVLEEIVGEIQDEYDVHEQAPMQSISENEAIFNTRVTVSEVNDTLGLNLPEELSDTIGGLVYNQLGKMPRVGDRIQVNDAVITVTEAVGRRIRQVRIQREPPPTTSTTQEDSNVVKPPPVPRPEL